MHDANRICTRASARFHGERGCQPPVEQKEEETDRRGGGKESKQNLHGNSVPVGRVELWVFNAVPCPPLALSLLSVRSSLRSRSTPSSTAPL